MTQIEKSPTSSMPAAPPWPVVPEGYDGRTHYGAVLAALVPAVGILAVAATPLLFAIVYRSVRSTMTLGTIIIILLILLLIGAIPAWPYSRSWGAFPPVFSASCS